jgi:hypothetical protein
MKISNLAESIKEYTKLCIEQKFINNNYIDFNVDIEQYIELYLYNYFIINTEMQKDIIEILTKSILNHINENTEILKELDIFNYPYYIVQNKFFDFYDLTKEHKIDIDIIKSKFDKFC